MGVLTGTLLGAEGEREQLTLSCSVQLTNQNVRDDQFSDSEYCDYSHHSMLTNVDDGDNGFVSVSVGHSRSCVGAVSIMLPRPPRPSSFISLLPTTETSNSKVQLSKTKGIRCVSFQSRREPRARSRAPVKPIIQHHHISSTFLLPAIAICQSLANPNQLRLSSYSSTVLILPSC